MMQISLTPTESKWLISKSLLKIDYFQRALKNGIIVIHPSSTTYFLYKELTGKNPENWVCGAITPKGACINRSVLSELYKEGALSNLDKFSQFWVFKKGKLMKSPPLSELITMLNEGDVYVKSPNAIDVNKKAGVLIGAPDGRGTVSRFEEASISKRFKILIPAGLEKLIPSVDIASEMADPRKLRYSMGMPVYLRPIQGDVVTEIEALKLLFNLKAYQIAAGGLSGAEGSVTLVVNGGNDDLDALKELLKEIKSTKLPSLETPECDSCQWKTCSMYELENIVTDNDPGG